ncbi:VWA domain-containing protein [Halobellus marinus]|uniref:VWA domain-containing protein n=1 Tax=Halobellus TaxID=1073986 RepID=UPI0028A9A0DD|nr:VWA domain-containing protein [Halobellus sp. DFY28]
MALSDVFLSPLGFAALLAAVPVIFLYLVRPDPRRVTLPTVRFLSEAAGTSSSSPLFERLKRSIPLLLQLLAILLFATALAAPYVAVSQSETVEETVVVLDASASMNVEDGGTTRFDRAVDSADGAVTSTTSVVLADGRGSIAIRDGTAADARETLAAIESTDAPGNLRTSIARATSVAGENARIVVLSDFAGDSDWESAVRAARARGLTVDLRQFDGGGADNVGIVDREFSGDNVTVSVGNFGDSEATRRVSLGDAEETLTLAPGDVRSVTLPVPAGGGEIRLSPSDSFPTDDVAYVAAPTDAAVDVLVVTNDRNRYLLTALSVIDPVSVTVVEPPNSIPDPPADAYDIVLYSNVDPEQFGDRYVAAGREAIAAGGGVGIQAGTSMPTAAYGDLLLIAPDRLASNPTLDTPVDDDLTRDITFPPPERYVSGDLRSGRALVSTTDGSPLIATADRGEGRILYYGYIESASSFKYDFEYPIFWKRSVFALADRESLSELNRATGDRLRFGNETTVETPRGEVRATAIDVQDAGFYVADGDRYSASLLSAAESDVSASEIDSDAAGGPTIRQERRTAPDPLTEFVALGIVAVALGELAFLRQRGDL